MNKIQITPGKLIGLIFSVVIVALVIVFYVFVINRDDKRNVVNESKNSLNNSGSIRSIEVCPEDILRRAISVINDTQVEKLSLINGEILKLTMYEKDINCLYITTKYNIYIGDATKADVALKRLEFLYSAGSRYNPILGENFRTTQPNDLRAEVDFLKGQKSNILKNFIQGPTVPEEGR